MGYTHYFTQTTAFTDTQWAQLLRASQKIVELSRVPISGPYGEPGVQPEFSADVIALNGTEPDDYESLVLHRCPAPQDWAFCKTGERPYDIVVVAILCAAQKIAPGVLEIKSDGDRADWRPGLDLAADALAQQTPDGVPFTVVLPPLIRAEVGS